MALRHGELQHTSDLKHLIPRDLWGRWNQVPYFCEHGFEGVQLEEQLAMPFLGLAASLQRVRDIFD